MSNPLSLAVDLGGTKVEAALVTQRGQLVPGSRTRRPTGPTATSTELEAAVTTVAGAALNSMPPGSEMIGIGIGSAGPVNIDVGRVSPLNLKVWRDYPLFDLASALQPDLPVRLRIDGLCIAIAENWVGAAQGVDSMLGMVVSTGIGGGFLLGGKAAPSPTGNAGHIGHIEVAGFDDPCACGGRGCVEAIASGPRTVQWANGQGWAGSSGEELAAAYRRGDPIARSAVRRSGTAIGHAIASATSLLDLDLVTIGGGFAAATEDLFQFARLAVAERTEFGFITRVRILPSGLNDEGPLIGAGALIHRPDYL